MYYFKIIFSWWWWLLSIFLRRWCEQLIACRLDWEKRLKIHAGRCSAARQPIIDSAAVVLALLEPFPSCSLATYKQLLWFFSFSFIPRLVHVVIRFRSCRQQKKKKEMTDQKEQSVLEVLEEGAREVSNLFFLSIHQSSSSCVMLCAPPSYLVYIYILPGTVRFKARNGCDHLASRRGEDPANVLAGDAKSENGVPQRATKEKASRFDSLSGHHEAPRQWRDQRFRVKRWWRGAPTNGEGDWSHAEAARSNHHL